MAIPVSDASATDLTEEGPPVPPILEPPLGARETTVENKDGSALAAGIETAVADAVATIADTALQSAAPETSPADLLGLTRGEATDRTGWVAAQTAALQAAAAGALSDTAKAAREVAVRRAKQQAVAAAELGRVKGRNAAAAAREHGSQAARAAQGQAAQTVAGIRQSGQALVTTAASQVTVQNLSRKARRASEMQQRQSSRLRRRQASVILGLAAIVGIAVGLWERRRRAAAASVQPELLPVVSPVDSMDLTGPSQPDSNSDAVATGVVSPEADLNDGLPASGGPQG